MRKILVDGKEFEFDFKKNENEIVISLNGKIFNFKNKGKLENTIILDVDGKNYTGQLSKFENGDNQIITNGKEFIISVPKSKKSRSDTQGGLISPMPGKIYKQLVNVGQQVKKGETLLILEAMKMEHAIKSPVDGTVKKVFFKVGDMVSGGVNLIEVE